jgi:hypothetical protein
MCVCIQNISQHNTVSPRTEQFRYSNKVYHGKVNLRAQSDSPGRRRLSVWLACGYSERRVGTHQNAQMDTSI